MNSDTSLFGGSAPAGLPSNTTPPRLVQLEGQVERLLMITEALWTILREQHGLDEQELLRQMVQIDIRDGKLDGRVASSPPEPCPKCHRIVAKRSMRCMFCGELIAVDPFAR